MTKKRKAQKRADGDDTTSGPFERAIREGRFKRRAIARTLACARQQGTETANEAELIARILELKGLDSQTHFNTAGFLATLYLKFQDMPGTARQAFLSDGRLARTLYPHVKNAFPEQVAAAFNVYFEDLALHAPHILDRIQQEADAAT